MRPGDCGAVQNIGITCPDVGLGSRLGRWAEGGRLQVHLDTDGGGDLRVVNEGLSIDIEGESCECF